MGQVTTQYAVPAAGGTPTIVRCTRVCSRMEIVEDGAPNAGVFQGLVYELLTPQGFGRNAVGPAITVPKPAAGEQLEPIVIAGYPGDHPPNTVPIGNGGSGGVVVVRESPRLVSSAAGRYQILARYWRAYKEQLHLPDFSPNSQDAVALQQMKERGALAKIEVGDISGAIEACANIWASFPGNKYGQGGHSLATLETKYPEFLGS